MGRPRPVPGVAAVARELGLSRQAVSLRVKAGSRRREPGTLRRAEQEYWGGLSSSLFIAACLATLWGKETRSATPTWLFASRPTRHQTAQMLWSICYRLLCWLLRLLVRCGLDEVDLENAVLQGADGAAAYTRTRRARIKPPPRARPDPTKRTGQGDDRWFLCPSRTQPSRRRG